MNGNLRWTRTVYPKVKMRMLRYLSPIGYSHQLMLQILAQQSVLAAVRRG